MPRIPYSRAIATRETIANLFAAAEQWGENTMLVPSREACFKLRQGCYAAVYRARKHAKELTGSGKGMYDDFTYSYEPYAGPEEAFAGMWQFTISYSAPFEIIILLPEWYDEARDGPIPIFDQGPEPSLEDLDLADQGLPYPYDDTYNPEPSGTEDD